MGVHIRIGKNTGDSNGPCTPRNSVVAAPVSGTIPFVSVNAPPRQPTPRSTRLPSVGVTFTSTSGSAGCPGFVTTPWFGPLSHRAVSAGPGGSDLSTCVFESSASDVSDNVCVCSPSDAAGAGASTSVALMTPPGGKVGIRSAGMFTFSIGSPKSVASSTVSALRQPAKGSGVLNDEIYIGVTFGIAVTGSNSDTAKRQRIAHPRGVVRRERSELRALPGPVEM